MAVGILYSVFVDPRPVKVQVVNFLHKQGAVLSPVSLKIGENEKEFMPHIRDIMSTAQSFFDKLATVNSEEVDVELANGFKTTFHAVYPMTYDRSRKEPYPLLVYIHGGGWCVGSPTSADPMKQLLADQADVIIFSIKYRFAPEYPFPTPLEDAYEGIRWVYLNGEKFNGDRSRFFVFGSSAGGNMAAMASILAREERKTIDESLIHTVPDIKGQYLQNGCFDVGSKFSSFYEFEDGYGLTGDIIKAFETCYHDFDNEKMQKAFPLQHKDLSDLPPALIHGCGLDPLRDQSTVYQKKLVEAGNTASVRIFPDSTHGCTDYLGDVFPEIRKEGVKEFIEFIRQHS